jgi:hypothetical protein
MNTKKIKNNNNNLKLPPEVREWSNMYPEEKNGKTESLM